MIWLVYYGLKLSPGLIRSMNVKVYFSKGTFKTTLGTLYLWFSYVKCIDHKISNRIQKLYFLHIFQT